MNPFLLICSSWLVLAEAQTVDSSTLASQAADNNLTVTYYIASIVSLLIISGCIVFCCMRRSEPQVYQVNKDGVYIRV
jgi:hypothetical protein